MCKTLSLTALSKHSSRAALAQTGGAGIAMNVFISGSLQGIGLGIARQFARAGHRLAVHGLGDQEQIQRVTAELEQLGAAEVRYFAADFSQTAQIDALMQELRAWGELDVLVNNAGVQKTISLAQAEAEDWDRVLAINLSAAFHTMRHALPAMAQRGYGRVINIASVHGIVASKNKAPYVSSKFGLIGLSKVAALEYAQAGSKELGGVTVNCIAPGWVETALIEPQIMARAELHGGDRAAGIKDMLGEKQPSLRTSSTEEIGALALWLCEPIAHNITGSVIPIDGGWTSQ